jgi:two-component system response regulator LytT
MNDEKHIKILIIEDDPTWSVFVESIISESKYKFIGAANTFVKAKAMIEGLKPDVIISDIRVQNLIIFDFLLEENYQRLPIIFMTNHLEGEYYELSQDLPKSTFLAKPFHKFTLLSTLELLLDKFPVAGIETEQFIAIRGKQQQVKKIMFSDIAWIQAEGNYSFVFTATKVKHVRKKTLKEYLKELDSRFIRVHKAYIINRNYAQRIDLGNKQITVADTIIPLGRAYRSELDILLEQRN